MDAEISMADNVANIKFRTQSNASKPMYNSRNSGRTQTMDSPSTIYG